MKTRFAPNDDLGFITRAENMARQLSRDPARFEIDPALVEQFDESVKRCRAAITAARNGKASRVATQEKSLARAHTYEIYKRLGNLIRSNPNIDSATKLLVHIEQRKQAKTIDCPQEPPRLRFVRAHHESAQTPRHELEFTAWDSNHRKPAGAVRLELWVGLIPPDEQVPEHLGAIHGGHAWYVQSYSTSPFLIVPPIARVPMRVLYWGRWAGRNNDYGPMSNTAAGWVEGGSHAHLPGGVGMQIDGIGAPKRVSILDVSTTPVLSDRDEKYRVAVLEVQSQTLRMITSMPEREARQLEGPVEKEAA